MINFYHQNYIRKLVSASMDPLTKVATENLDVVIDIKEAMKKLKRDFELEQANVKNNFTKMCTKAEMNTKINATEARQHIENKEFWLAIQKHEVASVRGGIDI
jgi:hypothetical protein